MSNRGGRFRQVWAALHYSFSSPRLKKSGKAVTIDGAFSKAYGDHGFTLVLEPLRTFIATRHHFESVQAAVERGADIVPSCTIIREWDEPRRIADSERGRQLGFAIERLEQLVEAYSNHDLPQRFSSHLKLSAEK